MFQVDDLRGKVGGLNETFVVGGQTGDEDTLFKRFDSGQMGAHFKLQPISALQIHALIGTNGKYTAGASYDGALADAFGAGQYGLGYTIDNIGFVRFQFQGGSYAKGHWAGDTASWTANPTVSSINAWNQIQLAFQLTAVQNLNLDFGVTIPLELKVEERDYKGTDTFVPYKYNDEITLTTKDSTYQAPTVIALGANYSAGDLGLLFRFDARFGEKLVQKKITVSDVADIDVESTRALGGLNFSVQPSYKLGDLGSILGVVSFGMVGNQEAKIGSAAAVDGKDGTVKLGLGLAFDKNLGGGGNFKIGIAAQIPVSGDKYDSGDSKADDIAKAKDTKIAIPIVFTYSIYP
jgi:hypothetical protein